MVIFSRIQINYLKFCKFLQFLPPWTNNRPLVKKFSVPDITLKLEILHRQLSSTAYARLSPHHRLICFFHWFCVYILYFSLCFCIYSYSTIFTLCIVWVINKLQLLLLYSGSIYSLYKVRFNPLTANHIVWNKLPELTRGCHSFGLFILLFVLLLFALLSVSKLSF